MTPASSWGPCFGIADTLRTDNLFPGNGTREFSRPPDSACPDNAGIVHPAVPVFLSARRHHPNNASLCCLGCSSSGLNGVAVILKLEQELGKPRIAGALP